MKAEITAKGNLIITPETGVEFYAARKWLDDWREKRVVLQVDYADADGEKTLDFVRPQT